MIVVDTSAVIAILFNEPERGALIDRLLGSPTAISAGSVIECVRVIGRRTPRLRPRLHALLQATATAVVAVDHAQVHLAEDGHTRFGKGRGAPPAVLNFGDLFAYALARQLDAPLLFKGDDFWKTDVKVALVG